MKNSVVQIFLLVTFLLIAIDGKAQNNSRTSFDFDGDRKADISVFRPSNGYWYIAKSSGGYSSIQWGFGNDSIVPGDYDGDGKTDLAVFRRGAVNNTNNIWYILRSSDNTLYAREWVRSIAFWEFYSPVPADYDGDGKTDLASYRLTDAIGEPGKFVVLHSSMNVRVDTQLGTHFYRTVPADYDGDGRADYAIFREGVWSIIQSSNGIIRTVNFGLPSDTLVPADYDGDGKEAQVVIKLRDKSKLNGYISEAGEESFVVTNAQTGESTTVMYSSVKQIKGNNHSLGVKIAIGVAIAAAIIVAVVILVELGFRKRDCNSTVLGEC